MGPPNLEVGDEVWILFGGRLPFALRTLQDQSKISRLVEYEQSKSQYVSLGDCYVHGIMNGEAMNGREKRTILLH
jgi:hypothetical protein